MLGAREESHDTALRIKRDIHHARRTQRCGSRDVDAVWDPADTTCVPGRKAPGRGAAGGHTRRLHALLDGAAMNANGTHTARAVAIGVFALAFVVRLEWVLREQSPLTAVFSDMAGYVDRATSLIDHRTPADPRSWTFYPYGAHILIALEFLFFGRNSEVAIGIVHALVGAVPAACMVLLTRRLVPSHVAAAVVGILVAVWQPQIVYVGFFMSEIWFSAAIAVHALLSAPGRGHSARLLAVGLLSALAFVVRPQFLVTWIIDTARHAFARRRRGFRRAAAAVAWLAVPMLVAMAASSIRLHRLSARWGLISDNGNLNRLFANTDICLVESNWITPTGERWSWYFAPPAKPPPCDETRVARFEGYIGDTDILGQIRGARLRGVSWTDRLARMVRNVELLGAKNMLFPENAFAHDRWRLALQNGFAAAALFCVLPLCAIGLVLGRRDSMKVITLANFAAVVIASACYYGEVRYRVPYDPFAILFAVVGVYEIVRRIRLARHAWHRFDDTDTRRVALKT